MVEGCGMRCIKLSMFAFNAFFALMGLIIMGVAIHHMVSTSEYTIFLKQGPTGITWALIIGLVIFIISFLGCYGAACEKPCMVITYASIILVILLLEITATAMLLVHKNNPKVEAAVKMEFVNTLPSYYNDTAVTKGIDMLQTSMECCGVDSPNDWMSLPANTNHTLPNSCCGALLLTPTGVESCTLDSDNLHKAGCFVPLMGVLNKVFGVFAALLIGVMLAQLIVIAFAFKLAREIRRGYETV